MGVAVLSIVHRHGMVYGLHSPSSITILSPQHIILYRLLSYHSTPFIPPPPPHNMASARLPRVVCRPLGVSTWHRSFGGRESQRQKKIDDIEKKDRSKRKMMSVRCEHFFRKGRTQNSELLFDHDHDVLLPPLHRRSRSRFGNDRHLRRAH